jgi:hypothetical protein
MTFNLDTLAGIMAIFISICAGTFHIVSDPKRPKWQNVPSYVRGAALISTCLALWRGVNLISLADRPSITAGHVNGEAIMSWFGFCVFFGSITFWQASQSLPDRAWQRIEWVRRQLHRRPDSRPVMLETAEQVVEVAHADGVAAIGPREGPNAATREGARFNARRQLP